MDEWKNEITEWFNHGEIDLFIGYEEGTRRPRPFFAGSSDDVKKLIFDNRCSGNLAVYLTRKDLTGGKKAGISASYYALKSILQLFGENQLEEENLHILGRSEDGGIKPLHSIAEIKQYIKETPPPAKQEEDKLIREIAAMKAPERWEFWTRELSECFKCYACRSACPMCYCTKCIVEVNRPQWLQPWASTLGNMEWQINRVMHLAGRCSDCGSCGAACPLGIPIHLLTHKMVDLVKENFGEPEEKGNVLSTFKLDDNENFIL
jgi:heterodisulfide reductase subunit C